MSRPYTKYPTAGPAQCAVCGDPFQRRHSGHLHCSSRCSWRKYEARGGKAPPERVQCEGCGDQFTRTDPKQRFCTSNCRSRSSERKRRQRDRALFRERWRAYYRDHPELIKARIRRWQLDNPDRLKMYAITRRARRARAGGSWSPAEWAAVLLAYGHRCAYCGGTDRITVDHRTPLTRGGSNTIDNVVPACKPCNSRKGTRTELEFLADLALGQLIRERGGRMDGRGAARRGTGGRS